MKTSLLAAGAALACGALIESRFGIVSAALPSWPKYSNHPSAPSASDASKSERCNGPFSIEESTPVVTLNGKILSLAELTSPDRDRLRRAAYASYSSMERIALEVGAAKAEHLPDARPETWAPGPSVEALDAYTKAHKGSLPKGASLAALRPILASAWRNETAARRSEQAIARLTHAGHLKVALPLPSAERVTVPAAFAPFARSAARAAAHFLVEVGGYHDAATRAAKPQTDALLEAFAGQVDHLFVAVSLGNEAHTRLLARAFHCAGRAENGTAGASRKMFHERLFAAPAPKGTGADARELDAWKSALITAAREAGDTDPKGFESCLGSAAAHAYEDATWSFLAPIASGTLPAYVLDGRKLSGDHAEVRARLTRAAQ